MDGVDIETPPQTPLFGFFFKAAPNSTVQPPQKQPKVVPSNTEHSHVGLVDAAIPSMRGAPVFQGSPSRTSMNTLMTAQLLNMGQMQMQMFQNMFNGPQHAPKFFPQPNSVIPPTNVEIDENREYPKIDNFFEALMTKQPGRNLRPLMQKLTDGGLFFIHEILYYSEEELLKFFDLRGAEPRWLLREVKKEVAAISGSPPFGEMV